MFGRSSVRLVCVLALVASAVVLAPAAASATAPKQVNPKYNIALPWYSECSSPSSLACSTKVLGALNVARKTVNGTTYSLPANFLKLTSVEQLLVLTNVDRAYYGQQPVLGLNSTLNTAAIGGVKSDADPGLVAKIAGKAESLYAANWATGSGEYANVLAAYYGWMYDDGLNKDGSKPSNLDCTKAKPAGCWGHRVDILQSSKAGTQRFMGAAGGADPRFHGCTAWAAIWENFASPKSGAAIPTIPTVTGLSPASGKHTATTAVTVTGYGFYGVSNAYVWAVSSKVAVVSGTKVTVTAPKHATAGTSGHLTVKTSGGTSSVTPAALFAYT
ncbi:IPT/TIG domain-containing protein [Jatrophihabitans sp.]|uniref:IPT/TIG domain-containing protein n=1 Tax=Jatrophihabitans sp. TaxID=1932789 RepID=UPI0030C6FF27|nr:hypothetical protein [Jatrophihabitans sp.]